MKYELRVVTNSKKFDMWRIESSEISLLAHITMLLAMPSVKTVKVKKLQW